METQREKKLLNIVIEVADHVTYIQEVKNMEKEDLKQELIVAGLEALPKWNGDEIDRGKNGKLGLRRFLKNAMINRTRRIIYQMKMQKRSIHRFPLMSLDVPAGTPSDPWERTTPLVEFLADEEEDSPSFEDEILDRADLTDVQEKVAIYVMNNDIAVDGYTYEMASKALGMKPPRIKSILKSMRKNGYLREEFKHYVS